MTQFDENLTDDSGKSRRKRVQRSTEDRCLQESSEDRCLQDIFVGRSTELSTLRRRVDDVILGKGGLFLIGGEPGVGKTRLVEETADYARSRAVHVLWGRSWEGEGAPAFWPWLQILRSFATEADSDAWLPVLGGGARDIARGIPEVRELVPELRDLLPDLDLPTDSEQALFRFLDSFSGFLKRLADTKPLLLILDDLHSADQDSLSLLQFLSDATANAPLLIVGTYRDVNLELNQPLSQLLGTVNRVRTTGKIILAGLQQAEVRLLLKIIMGADPANTLVQAIMELTDGNAFFVTEVVALLVRHENPTCSDLRDVWSNAPVSVREVIVKQLQAASPDCAAALAIASVGGREFDAEVVAVAMSKTVHECCRILDEAISMKVVEHVRIAQYRFRHALVRETIYESLSATARAQIHLSIAGALEGRGSVPSQLSMMAYHFFMSLPYGSAERAFDYAVRAGLEARQRLAYEEAILHFERSLELGGPRIPPNSRCTLLLQLGEAQGRAGRWMQSRRTFSVAAEQARELRNARQFAQAAIGFKGMMGATIPADSDAISLLRAAATLLGDADHSLLVRVLSALSRCLYFANMPEEVRQHSEKAISIAQRLGDDELIMLALEARITSLLAPNCVDQIVTLATQLLDKAQMLGNREMAFNARLYRNYCCLTKGDFSGSDVEVACAERLASETGNVRYSWQVPMIRSARGLAMGNVAESELLSESARSLGERVHDSSPTHNYMVQVFQRARFRGVFTDLDAAIALAETTYPDIAGYRAGMALILARQGHIARAAAMLRRFVESDFSEVPMDIMALWTLTVLAEAACVCGESVCSARLYEKLKPFEQKNVVMSWGAAFDGPVSYYLGLLAGSLRKWAAAARHFEHALVVNAASGSAPLLARTKLGYSDTLLREGSAGKAAKGMHLLHEAMTEFERFGMAGYLEQSRKLLSHIAGRSSHERTVHQGLVHPGTSYRPVETGQYLFRQEGEFWTIAFGGPILRLQHTRGLAILSILLRQPGTDVHVMDIISGVDGIPDVDGPQNSRHPGRPRKSDQSFGGDAGPLIDARARAEYRRRAQELRSELAEAEEFNDLGRAGRLRAEAEQLAQELSRAYGQGGRPRVAAAASERARVNVRNNVSAALKTVKRFDESLWRHLNGAVRTGTFCSYKPDRSIPWGF
jgi:tetratricopeptide (TPR) repeat protein